MDSLSSNQADFDIKYDENSNTYYQMQQEIDRLQEENNTFRAQFNEMTAMNEQLEKIHQKNIQLTKEIRMVNSEKDDLQRRLNISLQHNEELKKMKEQNVIQQQTYTPPAVDESKSLFEKEKTQWQNEKNDFQTKIDALQQSLQNEQKKNNDIQNSIDSLISLSNSYFQKTFSTIQDISMFLKQTSKPQINNRAGTPRKEHQISKQNIDALTQKIKKQRSQIKELKKLYSLTEAKASQYENDTIKSKEEANKIISDLETKLTNVQHNFQIQEMQNQYEVQMKDNQIKNLQEQLNEVHNTQNSVKNESISNNIAIKESNDLLLLKRQIDSYKEKVHDLNKTITQLKQDNSQLNAQLIDLNSTNEAIKKRLTSSDNSVSTYITENETLKSTISSLQIDLDKLQEQYQTSLSQIQSLEATLRQNESSQIENQSTFEKLQSSIQILEKVIEKQKKEQNHLYEEREKIITLLQKENSLFKNYENYMKNLSQENLQLKTNLQNQQIKYQPQEEFISNNNNSVPINAWCCKEFPSDLNLLITDTAKNENLEISTKIRYALGIIAKYYNKKIKEFENVHETLTKNDDQKLKLLEQLLDKVTAILNKSSLSVDTLISDPSKFRDLSSALENVSHQLGEKENEVSKLNESLLSIYSTLNVDNSEQAIFTINKLIQSIEQLKYKCDHQKSKMIKKIKEFQGFKSAFIQQHNEIESILNEQQDQYSKVVAERDEILEKLKQTEMVNSSFKTDLSRLNSEHKESLNIHEKKCDEVMINMKSQIEEVKNQYMQELNLKDKQIFEKQSRIQQLEKEVVQWKRTAELLKKSKIEKDNQIIEMTAKAHENEKNNQEKQAREKAQIKSQFEQLLVHIKSKNEELRKILVKTSKALEECQKKNKELLSINTQLSIEKQQNLARIDGMKEELEREHRLMETKLKASLMANELQMQNSIEEIKSQYDLEKRSIYSYIATAFRQFFNAGYNLDENAIRSLVDRVQAELTKLLKQDISLRKLLGVSQSEALENYISKLLVDMCHYS